MKTIHVQTGEPYDVHIGKGILSRCGEMIRSLDGGYRRAAVVTDDIVAPLYLGAVRESLEQAGIETSSFVFPHGEGSKRMDTALDIISALCESRITRRDLVVALGGGVAGDLAGFAASIYQRGIDYIQIPTTLLAAIDSSVGGKTAVNIPQGKNLAGTFWQPRLVLCDADTLSTLPGDVFADGVAEAVKYGCIWDEELFSLIGEGRLPDNLEQAIARCVEIKAEVVGADERDRGLRQILNFGHTIGHAVEKLSDFSVSHGRAVAVGMSMISAAGERAGLTAPGTHKRITGILEENGLPASTDLPVSRLCRACAGDKKREHDQINLIVPLRIGKCSIHPVTVSCLAEFFG